MIGIVLLVMVLQGGDVYKRLTIDDGLSQNMVNDILLDDRGFLWFATKDGLNRYDGHSFIVYRNYPGQLETLTSNHITSLVQTPDGTIWMTTYGGGINRIDPITGSGDPVPGSMQADVTFASAIRADSEQTLWVLSQSDGLIRLDPTTMTYDVLKEQPAFRNVGDISLFELTDQDRIWAVSSQMIQYIDPKTSRLLQWPVVDPADRPTSLLVLNDSLIVFSTRTGLQRMRVSGDRLVREVTSIRNQRFGFGNAFIKDRQGRIWFASLHDLYRYDPTEDRLIWLFHHGTRPTSSMLVDHSGILWIGTAGWGVMKYNPSRQYLRRGVGPYPPHVIPELIGAMRRNGQPIPDWLSGTDHAFHRTASGDEWISISGFRVYRYRPGSAEPSTILKAASDQIGGILKSVREITHNLRPPELDRIGITETIRYTLEKGTSAAGLKLEADIQPFNRRIPADLEINLLRIVQEMLSNTIKHAGATSVTCRITAKETELMLHYHDDGVGLMSDIETITLRNGLGMLGLAERVRILGGALTLNGRGGPGLSYELRIPLHQTT